MMPVLMRVLLMSALRSSARSTNPREFAGSFVVFSDNARPALQRHGVVSTACRESTASDVSGKFDVCSLRRDTHGGEENCCCDSRGNPSQDTTLSVGNPASATRDETVLRDCRAYFAVLAVRGFQTWVVNHEAYLSQSGFFKHSKAIFGF